MDEQALLVDSHAHLDGWKTPEEEASVLARARAAGVVAVVDVGTDEATSRLAVEAALRHSEGDARPSEAAGRLAMVLATVGVHPHDASAFTDAACETLRALAARPRVVAIGECGLDYFRDLSPREVQRRVFARQLALAREVGLPVVVHCREAYGECLDIVRGELGVPARGVLHCFQGDADAARRALDLGLCLGIGGSLTFPREEALRRTVAGLPLERLLVETDSPYLTPRPRRGRNEPALVRLVAECLARVLSATIERVAEATTANACQLFRLGEGASRNCR